VSNDASPLRAEGRLANVSAALLLGGSSQRMGTDKAHLEWNGEALATRAARLLDQHFDDVLLVGGMPPATAPGRRGPDGAGPRCALRGVVSALDAAPADRVLIIATDLPWLGPELLLTLVAWPEADVVVPTVDGRDEPLCAIWSRHAVLPRARSALAAGRLALHELIGELHVQRLEGDDLRAVDPLGRMLANANTPEEWAQIAALAPSDE
jgi:molybdopterin-guanine dinucleotide biosynthesis protein A